jgi:hypothetical protein
VSGPCHLGLGKLYRRTGKRQEAREYFATAMYHEMNMQFWLEQAERGVKELEEQLPIRRARIRSSSFGDTAGTQRS